MNAIEITNVSKTYSDFAIQNISFSLPQGSILGLVGENGAGKSTLIKLIMNTVKRDGGKICVLGSDNESQMFPKVKQDIGVVLDEAYFPELLNVGNVNSIMEGTYTNWDSNKFFSYIKRFSLPEKKAFKDFSRGMRMKMAIAVALSHSPKLLILDEATSGLDPMVRDEMLDIFCDAVREQGCSVLLSSHIVSDLEKICDYIAFIHKGRLILCEEKDKILSEYVIFKLSKQELESVPSYAIMGKKESYDCIEVLAKRGNVPPSLKCERTTLEDIIVFFAKGDR